MDRPTEYAPAKRSRFRPNQIVAILAQAADGTPVAEICRRHGIRTSTFYAWRKRFSAESRDVVARLQLLEQERAAAARTIAEYERDLVMLRALVRRHLLTAEERRAAARWLMEMQSYSERRACFLASCGRSTFRYGSGEDALSADEEDLRGIEVHRRVEPRGGDAVLRITLDRAEDGRRALP